MVQFSRECHLGQNLAKDKSGTEPMTKLIFAPYAVAGLNHE